MLLGTLSALYLKRRGDDLSEQFRERSLWRAQVFADLASRRFDADDWRELFSTIFTASDVLYAQVVYRGQVRATRGSIPVPPVQPLARKSFLYEAYSPQVSETRTTAGQAYLDILYPVTVPGESSRPDSYVRLGLSLAPLQQELRNEMLTITLLALVALALAAVITVLLARSFFSEHSLAFPTYRADAGQVQGAASILGGEGVGERPEKQPALVVDNAGKRVFLNGSEVKLSPKEYELVRLLASEPGRVFSNGEILQAVWAGRQWATAQDVKQYVYFVRKKLETDPENPRFIITVRGFGYKLQLD